MVICFGVHKDRGDFLIMIFVNFFGIFSVKIKKSFQEIFRNGKRKNKNRVGNVEK
jgi:hypothetical protein